MSYIKFRKKYILPIKWFFSERKKFLQTRLLPLEDILEIKQEVEEMLLEAERKKEQENISKNKLRLELLNNIPHSLFSSSDNRE